MGGNRRQRRNCNYKQYHTNKYGNNKLREVRFCVKVVFHCYPLLASLPNHPSLPVPSLPLPFLPFPALPSLHFSSLPVPSLSRATPFYPICDARTSCVVSSHFLVVGTSHHGKVSTKIPLQAQLTQYLRFTGTNDSNNKETKKAPHPSLKEKGKEKEKKKRRKTYRKRLR